MVGGCGGRLWWEVVVEGCGDDCGEIKLLVEVVRL